MAEQATPRRMVKALLRGEQPPRPLLLPIIFSLGSRLENLSRRDFQSNPTKIANALRQIRSVLKVDGLACYFDPFLEMEALGCKLNWQPDGSPVLLCPHFSGIDDLRRKLRSADEVLQKGRIGIASDVLQRLKVMLREEPALMVGVTGPLTLAAHLWGTDAGAHGPLPLGPVEFAAEITAAVSKNFVESGADLVFVVENHLPQISADAWRVWPSLLDPIINVIRFYEALPVLLWGGSRLSKDACAPIFDHTWECVLCPKLDDSGLAGWETWQSKRSGLGVALSASLFGEHEGELKSSLMSISKVVRDQNPILLTTAGDIPGGSDMKHLGLVLDSIRECFSYQAQNPA